MSQKTALEQFVQEEVGKVEGIYYPVKAGFLRLAFVRKASVSKLHPNPEDEFCDPKIGPHSGIVADYEKQYLQAESGPGAMPDTDGGITEPIMVEKTRPDGYMILNGHHRWAAAHMAGIRRLRIKVINLTSESDVRKMLQSSVSDRRVSLDLDELVLRSASDPDTEPPFRFPLSKIYPERLRRGIPALFTYLHRHGYDIWVYSSRYYSYEYLKYFFRHHHLHVTGIITRIPRATPGSTEAQKKQEKMIGEKYSVAAFIDSRMVTVSHGGSKELEIHDLAGDASSWSSEVIEIFRKISHL